MKITVKIKIQNINMRNKRNLKNFAIRQMLEGMLKSMIY